VEITIDGKLNAGSAYDKFDDFMNNSDDLVEKR